MTLCRDCSMPVGVATPKCTRCGGRWPYLRSRRFSAPLTPLLGAAVALAAVVGVWTSVFAHAAP